MINMGQSWLVTMRFHQGNMSQFPCQKLGFHYLQDCWITLSSLFYTVGPCWLSILNIAMHTCQSKLPITSPNSPPTLLETVS